MILTNFFIEALFSLERAISDGEDDEVLIEGYNEEIDTAKKNIMNYSSNQRLTEHRIRMYIDNITKYFNENYSDDIQTYPRINESKVNEFVNEIIGAGKSKKKKATKKKKKATKKKKKATKKKKKATKKKKKATKKKGKLAGNPDCQTLDENDCKSNGRCKWNEFQIEDFDMDTSKGKQKLFDLKESLMKTYTKKQLLEQFGNEDPSFFQVFMRAKKEYDNGLRGLCGNKMFHGSKLGDILQQRLARDYPDSKPGSKKKNKVPQKEKDLVEDMLEEAMKKNKPDKEIQSIIDRFGLHEKDLQKIYDKNNKQFSRLDRFLSPDHDEVSSLLEMVDDEVKLERKEDSDLQARIDKLKKSGKSKKTKKAKKKAKK